MDWLGCIELGWVGRSPRCPQRPFPVPVPGVFREAVTEFEVDARALAKAGGPLVKALVSNPSGNVTETFVEDRGDGTYHVEYTPYEEGERAGNPGRSCADFGRFWWDLEGFWEIWG